MTTALAGLRVIDLTRNVAGPYATRLLVEFGAEVLKLEPPGGDPARAFGPFPADAPDPERSGLFLHLNRNKRSAVLDPARDAGVIRALAQDADLVIEDYAPGAAAGWGWGYETLRALNPKLVMTSITPYGQSGPYRDYQGSELTLQAIGGALISNGNANREPLKLGGHFAHYHAALAAALASMVAMRRAAEEGAGDWVDISVHQCQAACRDRRVIQMTVSSYTGLHAGRMVPGVAKPLATGPRQCSDGFVNIFGAGPRLPRFLQMIGRGDIVDQIDPNAVTPEQSEELDADYQSWLDRHTKREATQTAQDHALLAGAFNTIADVVDDPHYQARGVWETVADELNGSLVFPGRPFTMSAAARVASVRAPRLDEHRGELPAPIDAPAAVAPDEADLSLPLAGLRVAEITVVWAGPHVTQLLAEWGADVVRIEPMNKVQPVTRGMEGVPSKELARESAARTGIVGFPDNDPSDDPWNRNAAFNSQARNKRSMTCDIMTEAGRAAVLRLVAEIDVLVENNVPETIDKAGLDWNTLRAINPRLIFLRMPAFALEGPYRNYRAFGLHVEAMIGHTLLRGYPGEGPEALSESLASDGISGVQGALAIMMALRHRDATGEGQLIELPLTEGFLPTLGEYVMDYSMNGRDTPPQGNRHPHHAPHNVYRTQGEDDWIAIDVADDAAFAALCSTLGIPDVVSDARFTSRAARLTHSDELDALITQATVERDKEGLFHALQAAGVNAAPTHNALEALSDEQLRARDFFEALPTGNEGKRFDYPGLMFRMQRTPNAIRTGPVLLGQHNHEIYCDWLGFSETELAEMEQAGTVGTAFPKSIWNPPS